MDKTANVTFVTSNVLDDADISASPACVPSLPQANFTAEGYSKKVRTTSLAYQSFIFDFRGEITPMDFFVFAGFNHSVASTVRLRAYSGADASGNVLYDSGYMLMNPPIAWGDYGDRYGVIPWGASEFWNWNGITYFTHKTDEIIFPQSVKADFTDTAANRDGYMEWGRAFFGLGKNPEYNAEWGLSWQWLNEHKYTRTAGGSLRTEFGPEYRKIELSLHAITEEERGDWTEFLIAISGKPVFFSGFPKAEGSKKLHYNMIAKMPSPPNMPYLGPGYYQMQSITLEEA